MNTCPVGTHLREQREDWFINYEIEQNKQFLNAVAEGRDIEELRLRLGIILKETGEFIGWCCTGIKDELPYPNREIMYAISSKHRNKGYTTQAVEGVINYLFQNTNIDVLNTLALVRNIPSNRVIQKCGFYFQSIIEIENEKYNYYKISKSEWENFCHMTENDSSKSKGLQGQPSVFIIKST